MATAANHTPLHGWSVLCLRPTVEVRTLADAVRKAGGAWISLPTLRIEVALDDDCRRALELAMAAPLAIFTSVNAVRSAQHMVPLHGWSGQALAVGRRTAQALRRAGVARVLAPARMDSEGLLALAALDPPPARVALLTGSGGRGLLEPALRQRGAEVVRVDLYRRHPRPPAAQRVHQLLQRPAPLALLVSSGEALEVLLATPELAAAAPGWHAIAASARLAALCRERGLRQVAVAASASGSDLLAALLDHAKHTPFR